MKVPRFGISYLMIFVAIVALNFGAIRVWYQLRLNGVVTNNRIEVLTYGIWLAASGLRSDWRPSLP